MSVVDIHLRSMTCVSTKSRATRRSIKVCRSFGTEPVVLRWSKKALCVRNHYSRNLQPVAPILKLLRLAEEHRLQQQPPYTCLSTAVDNDADSAAIVPLTTREMMAFWSYTMEQSRISAAMSFAVITAKNPP